MTPSSHAFIFALVRAVILVAAVSSTTVAPTLAGDWPMLGHDPARSGATQDALKPPFARKWYRLFADEGIQSGVQPVIADGTVFLGTLRGVLHAMDADTGQDRWRFQAGGPILHAAAVADGRVMFGAADGKIYALAVQDGQAAWTVATGSAVWSAPACAGGVTFVGSRDGWLYAIETATGRLRWRGECGAPLLNSPAVDVKSSRVIIGAEDMRVRAFSVADGRLFWTSPKLPGCSLRGYHPVIVPDGLVMITSEPVAGYDQFQDLLWEMSRAVFGNIASWKLKTDAEKLQWRERNFAQLAQPETFDREMDWLRQRLEGEPGFQTFFVLNGSNGTVRARPPVVASESMNGPGAPPLVTPDGRVMVKFQAVLRSRYEHYSPFLNPGWLDAATGGLKPLMAQDRTYGWHDSLLLVHDEQSQLSLAGSLLLNTHQDNVNALDLTTLRGYPEPLAVNVHEPRPGQAAALRLAAWRGRELAPGSEWLARGTAIYGGGSVLDVPVAVAGDSFYYLPTHELNSGCALIAYRMTSGALAPIPQDRGAFPAKVEISPDEWKRLQDQPWVWDTLATPRLKAFLEALPGPVPGTTGAPLWEEAEKAVAGIADSALDDAIWQPAFDPAALAPASDGGVCAQLAAAVHELLARKWRPFHFPAGKAPKESWLFFRDPAQTLTTLLLARPCLDREFQHRIDAAAMALVGEAGLAREFPAEAGDPRERYDVPLTLIHQADEPRMDELARLYPLWLWSRLPEGAGWVKAHWPDLRDRLRIPAAKETNDCGNARLAGLLAYCRLAKSVGDDTSLAKAVPMARQALRERLRYEFAHPRGGVFRLVNGQRSVATRWRNLTPDVAALLSRHARSVTERLMADYADWQRPGWWLAWNVEQLWANETPFQLPTTAYEFFAARALILHEPPAKLAAFLDQPWCAADEFFIRKLALILHPAKPPP